jgi:hypothetical protein
MREDQGKVISLDSRRPSSALVHRKQIVTAQLVPFPSKRLKKRRPRSRRNASALLPLLDGGPGLPNIGGHLSERVPGLKHIVNRAHRREYAADELSDQAPPMIPMTICPPIQTISPMGRASTPVKFRAEMAKRLMSARIVAGFETKKQAAEALGITLDRYEKWESGRTPVPAQYVGPVCELFRIDANYLFGVQATPAAASRKTA